MLGLELRGQLLDAGIAFEKRNGKPPKDKYGRATTPFKVDQQGHTAWLDFIGMFEISYKMSAQSDAAHEALIEAWNSGIPMTEPVTITYHDSAHEACTYCGQAEWLFDGFTLTAANPCPHPNGMTIKVRLDVPSGKILVGNDFRDEFPLANNDHYVNILSEIGRAVTDYAEKADMLHFFVGNTSPGVYRLNGELVVMNAGYSDDDEEILPEGAECVASVCTDLWWVSMVDYDEAVKRGLSTDGPGWTSNDVIEVTPGTYELTYHGIEKDFDRDAYDVETRWASLELIETKEN